MTLLSCSIFMFLSSVLIFLIVDGSGADSNGEGEDEDEDDQKRRGGRASKEGTFTILSVTTLAATVNALVVILEKVSDD